MEFHWYGMIVGVGIVLALSLAEKILQMKKGSGELVWEAFWWMALPGLLGARIYHVISEWEYYQEHLTEILNLSGGGLGIWGAVVGSLVGLLLYSIYSAARLRERAHEVFLLLADVYALVAPLAQSLGRWGNLVNGEIWGKMAPSSWKFVEMVPGAEGRHPLFLYESGLNLALFITLLLVYRRSEIRGSLFGGYLVGYGVIRLALEPLRESDVWVINGVAVASVVSVVAVGIGLILLYRPKRFVMIGSPR